MIRDSAALCDHTRAELDVLIADGITPTAEEIIRLNALGWEVESPQIKMALSRGVPVSVGGVLLWPRTLAAWDWYMRTGCRLPTYRLQRHALAYCMAYSRSDGDELDRAGKDAERAVRQWARRLRCTDGELDVAMAQCLQQDTAGLVDNPDSDNSAAPSAGEIVAALSAMTGLPSEHFERRVTASHALLVLHHAVIQQAQAEGGKVQDQAYIAAVRAEAIYIDQIRARHNVQA